MPSLCWRAVFDRAHIKGVIRIDIETGGDRTGAVLIIGNIVGP